MINVNSHKIHLFDVIFARFPKDDGNILIVSGCSFEDIKCSNDGNCVLFNDALDLCDVSMTGISIIDCESALYQSDHATKSELTLSDIMVETSKLWADETDTLLLFAAADSVLFFVIFVSL